MGERINKRLQGIFARGWKDGLTVILLVLTDIAIKPFTAGPDRLIHDPAVYRLGNSLYLPSDWYTEVAVNSGVYTFYAKLINSWRLLHIPEELWRQLLYLVSITVLYWAIVKIVQIFTRNRAVPFLIVGLHAFLLTGTNQPVWLYGPFLQIDGGFAPRTLGVAASFLALLFLLRGSWKGSMSVLGLSTLIHVSNSLIVFTLFFAAWATQQVVNNWPLGRETVALIAKRSLVACLIFLVTGGWFALLAASKDHGAVAGLSTEKFIWVWTYFRAPYMALPSINTIWWVRLFFHVLLFVGAWAFLWPRVGKQTRPKLMLLGLVGIGALTYFFLFYLFAFVHPWMPGFQFYSIRVAYFVYFAAYSLGAIAVAIFVQPYLARLTRRLSDPFTTAVRIVVVIIACGLIFQAGTGKTLLHKAPENLTISWKRLIEKTRPAGPPSQETLRYLIAHQETVLIPPDWNSLGYYLPKVVSFKSFGFTKIGLAEWYHRIDEVSGGELERAYQKQMKDGKNVPYYLPWPSVYSRLTKEDVQRIASSYGATLFLSYKNTNYPFPVIAEDSDFRLYQLPK